MFGVETFLDVMVRSAVLTTVALLWVLLLVRVIGLRSFSKMTAFDFVTTVAMGSLLAGASTASSWSAFSQAVLAMMFLLAVQWVLALARIKSKRMRKLIANTPVLLMENGRFCEAALRHTRVAREDVLAKIRTANALRLEDVRAVILENTGDISVLHGDSVDEAVLDGVARLG